MSERKKKAARKAEPGPRPGGSYDYGHPAFEARDRVENLAGKGFYPAESFSVVEWHPLPDGQGRPTQVHLVIEAAAGIRFLLRLKSKEACDGMIETLRRHRNNVWGDS